MNNVRHNRELPAPQSAQATSFAVTRWKRQTHPSVGIRVGTGIQQQPHAVSATPLSGTNQSRILSLRACQMDGPPPPPRLPSQQRRRRTHAFAIGTHAWSVITHKIQANKQTKRNINKDNISGKDTNERETQRHAVHPLNT